MGEATPVPRRRWGFIAIAFVASLFGVAAFSGLQPSSAFACNTTSNPDGSKTCTSDPYTDVCSPTGSFFIVDYIPVDATIMSHQLTHNPACPGATIVENSFEDNATGDNGDGTFPNPPAGQRAVRVKYTITCNPGPCAGSTVSTLTVTYTQPTSGGGGGGGGGAVGQTPTSPPSSDPSQLPAKVKVDPKSGAAMVPWDPPDLPQGDFFGFISWLLNDAFSKPQPRSAVSAAKGKVRMGGTLKGSHPAGLPGTLTLQLNGRAKRALLAAGKLNVTIRATISNAAGSTPFTGKLKLVAKSSK